LCRAGSDKVPAELEREFTDLTGFPIDEGYGCTEAGLISLNPPRGPVKLGSVGRPLPGFTLAVRNEEGREVAAGAEGRLWVKSGSVMAGYWNDRAASEATTGDGWLDTGDVMTADDDGYL
jgi:long-subunit acyl-CoA synthetase (AMP-forming)